MLFNSNGLDAMLVAKVRKDMARDILDELITKQVICSSEEDNFVYFLDIMKVFKKYCLEEVSDVNQEENDSKES